jgi:PqqD family protein of HPr-rel-A system
VTDHTSVHLSFPESLRVRHWADECLVYDGHSGRTHLLAYPAGVLLDALAQGEQQAHTLATAISEASGIPQPEAATYVENTLASLKGLGLLAKRRLE